MKEAPKPFLSKGKKRLAFVGAMTSQTKDNI